MNRSLPAVLALALAVAGAAHAAPAPPARALTLPELTDLSLHNNPQTRMAWAQLRESQAAQTIARAAWWPTITASFVAQRSQSIGNEGAQIPPQTRYGPSLSISWLLLDFGARSGNVALADAEELAARFTVDRTLQDLTLEVETDYYTVIGTQAVEDASRQSLAEAQGNLDAAQSRQQVGTATVADVYQAQAALAAATLALQRAEGARVIAQGALAVAAGYDPDSPVTLIPWQAPENPELPATTAAQLMQAAREARPDLLAAKAREQAAASAIRAARSGMWPTVLATGNAGRTTIVDRGRTQQYSVALRADWPLFSGFSVRGAIAQAEAALDLAQATTDSLRATVEQDVWVAMQNLQTARKSIDASHAELVAAAQAAEVIRARYQNGLATILEVLTVEATLAQARVADIQAGIDWFQATAALGHAAGGLTASAP